MVMITIQLSYVTCLVTNDAWNAYDVIGVYNVHHGAGRISYFADPAIPWFFGTPICEVGPRSI